MSRSIAYIGLVILLHTACTANKFLPPGEKYYEGSSIRLESDENIRSYDRHETEEDIRQVFRINPNLKVIKSRPRVWFYHLAGDVQKERGFKYWLKYKLGERPVYISEVDIPAVRNLVSNRLLSNGFFETQVRHEIDSGKHAASIHYIASVDLPYRLDSIASFTPDSLAVMKVLNSYENTLLTPGKRYDFELLQEERVNREGYLRNAGYYFFSDRYILFEADSTVGDHEINIYPTLKQETPRSARQMFRISEVNVNADYNWAAGDSAQVHRDTLNIENINFIDRSQNFRPNVIINHVGFRPGDIYSRRRELNTLNRLVQLDVFQYVNVTFEEMSDSTLQANVFLSPTKKKSFRATIEGVSTSNNFAGPHLTVTFMNRNFLGGAERLELNVTTGYEWQFGGGGGQKLSNYEVGLEGVVTVPRLVQPFNIDYRSSRYIPVTKFRLGTRFQRRVRYYQMNSAQAEYGFEWRETATKRHTLYPVSIKYLRLGQRTAEFDSLLNNNPYLERSFENQYILGSRYGYYYSSKENKSNADRPHNFYFNGNLDLSGNLLHLSQNLFAGQATDSLGNYTLFGQTYSQFVRASVDFRHYWQIDRKNTVVSRFMTGVGYAFGNSETLPYSMQFAAGGSNSLRAFRARTVGPGSFVPQDTVSFIDQTADIKLEMNVEYRFDILGSLKGAVFVDAGNIWSLRKEVDNEGNELRPGAQFKFSNLLDELAVGTGFGVRYDFKFFVIRLDLGIPVRVPYQYTDENGEPANFPVRPWNRDWLSNYLVWNLAIGYPF